MKKILFLFSLMLSLSSLHGNNITWSTSSTTLSGSGVNASSPQIAIDTNGDLVAVWVENNLVKAKTQPSGGSWSSAVTISATGASSPSLVSDQSGNATAVWLESGVVKAATLPFGGSWSSSTALSSSGATTPVICVDSAGDVIAAWARSGNIETSTKTFGGSWATHTTITSSAAVTPSIAVGGSGSSIRAVLVWQGNFSGSIPVIYTSTKTPLSASWSSEQLISESIHNSTQPAVAVDANANAVAVWYSYDINGLSDVNVTVKTAFRPISTGTWSSVTALSSPGLRVTPSSLNASVAFDSIGNAIALWNISFDDRTFNIESAIRPVNGAWSAPLDLVTSNLYAYNANLSSTAFGDVLSVYQSYNGSSLLIQSIESDINGFLNNTWSVPIIISQGTDNAFPKVAAALSSNTINAGAIWVSYNGTNTTIQASTGSKTLVLPPSGLSVTQSSNNFGAFTEYYNTLSWTASTDPNAVGYLIFRNGTFIGQVGSGTTSFVDDNRVQSGHVVYSVTAVDALQTQSTTVSVTY